MKTKKHFSVIPFMIFLLFLALTGCRTPDRDTASAAEESTESMLSATLSDAAFDDHWKKDGFAYESYEWRNADNVMPFQETRYAELSCPAPGFSFSSDSSLVRYLRNIRYELTTYTLPDEPEPDVRYILVMHSSDSPEPRRTELFTDEKPAGRLLGMDVVTESDIALLFVSETGYQLLHLDGEGKILSRADLSSCFRENGLSENTLQYYWWCDEQGNSYALSTDKYLLYIFDDKGETLMTHKVSPNRGETVPSVCHAPDGSLLFAWATSTSEANVVWFDLGRQDAKILSGIEANYLRSYSMERNGQFLYADERAVWLWDTQTGEVKKIFSYDGSDIGRGSNINHLAVTPEGELLLYARGKEHEAVYVLSDQIPEVTDAITLVNFTQDNYAQQCVATFNRGHSGEEQIQYKQISYAEQDDYWVRLMADLTAGKGPDMLCLDATVNEQLDILWEKGILAELDDWIPQETLDHIFPGILACGTIDGKLVGVGSRGWIQVVVTSDRFCPGDNWSQQDVLELLKQNPDIRTIYRFWDGNVDPSFTLNFLLLRHLENSPFVDREKRESHFESEEFQTILKLCKEYKETPESDSNGINISSVASDSAERLKTGSCLAFSVTYFGMNSYCELQEQLDGHARYTGFPGQTSGSGYWINVPLIVVNARSEHIDAIKDYLQLYLAPEEEYGMSSFAPGRDDTTRNFWSGSFERMYDGKYDIEDYIAFLKKVGPYPRGNSAIAQIISEETEIFFSGSRDAAKTAEIIDNRVQLYLNEQD